MTQSFSDREMNIKICLYYIFEVFWLHQFRPEAPVKDTFKNLFFLWKISHICHFLTLFCAAEL